MNYYVKVSIVTVCYNYGHYLTECMESVQAQTFRDYEHIVVDPGSTDDTALIVDRYGKKAGRVTDSGKPFGLSSSKNIGIECSGGEYIVCLDADDRLHPTFLERMVQKAGKGVIVCPGLREFDGGTNGGWPQEGITHHDLLGGNRIFCASMYHREDWELAGKYDPKLDDLGYEDWDLWLRLTGIGCIVKVVSDFIFFYRGDARGGHPGSSTTHTIKRHDERMAYLRGKYPNNRF